MIWLSPTSGIEECSIYFEIRDIDLKCRGDVTSGVVRGLLGDGSCELWGEVFLGLMNLPRFFRCGLRAVRSNHFLPQLMNPFCSNKCCLKLKYFCKK